MKKQAKAFAEKTKVSEKTANRILSLLYEKGLDATQFSRLMWRLESFVLKTKLPEMIDKLNDAQVSSLIDEIIAEDEQMTQDGPLECSENLGLWLFSEFAEDGKQYAAGDMVEIQIMRTGTWIHPAYGKIEINSKTLSEVKKNFDNNVRKIDLAVDENHEPNHKALAWFRELLIKEDGDALFAKMELTKKGAELLTEGAYKYFSPEIVFQKQDEETGKVVKNLLIGGAFTNRPFFKAMQPLLASEEGATDVASRHQSNAATQTSSNFLVFNFSTPMKKILELLAQFSEAKAINAEQKAELEACFNAMSEEDKTAELTNAFNECVAKFSDEAAAGDSAGSDEGADKAGEAASGADGSDDAGASDGEGAGDGADAEGKDDSAADKAKEVKASEGEEVVSIKASELAALKNLASQTSKLVREKRKSMIETKVNGMKFSEGNAIGIVLPKNVKEIVDFAAALSEPMEAQFFSIISKLQTVAASEVGHSGSADAQVSAEEIAFFTEKMGMSKEEAIEAAKLHKASVK